MYLERKLTQDILELGELFPIVAVLGPRQVGKSTLVNHISKLIDKPTIHLDLELPSDLQKLNFPEVFFQQHENSCVIIDEVQLRAELFGILRPIIDKNKQPFRFIITGSASPELLQQSSESLAGRIAYTELMPFVISELAEDFNIANHHFIGGFPLALLSGNKKGLLWLNQFLKTYIERDLPILGFPANASATRKLWEMLAWQAGQLVNYTEISRSMGISANTVKHYIDFLKNSYLIDLVTPYRANTRKRLVKSPKIFFNDTGVLHSLLQIESYDKLLGSPFLGNSWENYIYNQIKGSLKDGLNLHFYRTHAGAEIDIVIASGNDVVSCIEVKFADIPKLSKGFYSAIDDLNPNKTFIITPNLTEYSLDKNITVTHIKSFLNNHLSDL